MSVNKLGKRPSETPRVVAENFVWKPIILTDSKGGSIRRECRSLHQIQWEILSGATTQHYENWIRRNLSSLRRLHKRIHFFLWTGTCDFTQKVQKCIYLNDNLEEAVKEYRDSIHRIKKLITDSENVRITYLPIPYLSIETWNCVKRHTDTSAFKEQDKKLTEVIDTENSHLKDRNQRANTYAPNLNADFIRSRKSKGKKQRYSINLKLLTDGVHPGANIAKAWSTSISRCIVYQCRQ